ncbi:MAG: hypothetical protein AAF384_02350 [Pseudomonadota bacterium]
MALYENSNFPIGPETETVHTEELATFSQPGVWFDGAERRSIAQAARRARIAAGIQGANTTSDAEHDDGLIDETMRLVIDAIAARPMAITEDLFDDAIADGLSEGRYVEIAGICARLANLDDVARGLNIDTGALLPAQQGEPSRETPSVLKDEGAWAKTIPSSGGGPEGEALYGGNEMQPFIYRSISQIPPEAKRQMITGDLQYLSLENFMDFNYSAHPSLTRAQVEILSGRVSAFNECFY